MKKLLHAGLLGLIVNVMVAGCFSVKTQHEIKPIEIKPIHITMDINLKVDRELDKFFGDLDETQAGESK